MVLQRPGQPPGDDTNLDELDQAQLHAAGMTVNAFHVGFLNRSTPTALQALTSEDRVRMAETLQSSLVAHPSPRATRVAVQVARLLRRAPRFP